MMEEDVISNFSIRLKLSLTVWDFVLPATPSLPAVIGVSCNCTFNKLNTGNMMLIFLILVWKNIILMFERIQYNLYLLTLKICDATNYMLLLFSSPYGLHKLWMPITLLLLMWCHTCYTFDVDPCFLTLLYMKIY